MEQRARSLAEIVAMIRAEQDVSEAATQSSVDRRRRDRPGHALQRGHEIRQ